MTDDELDLPSMDEIESELGSPRLQFYLRHKAEIEEWAALKNDVREATSDLLFGFRDDLEALAPDLGPTVSVRVDGVGTKWPRLVLVRAS